MFSKPCRDRDTVTCFDDIVFVEKGNEGVVMIPPEIFNDNKNGENVVQLEIQTDSGKKLKGFVHLENLSRFLDCLKFALINKSKLPLVSKLSIIVLLEKDYVSEKEKKLLQEAFNEITFVDIKKKL